MAGELFVGYRFKMLLQGILLSAVASTVLAGVRYAVPYGHQQQHSLDYGFQAAEQQPVYDSKGQPYEFGYQIKDDDGNTQHRQEGSDEHGTVKGSYGYKDAYGIYRQVNYIADGGGFRAVIKTNEPGVENKDPADVSIEAEHPPVQDKGTASAPVFAQLIIKPHHGNHLGYGYLSSASEQVPKYAQRPLYALAKRMPHHK